MNAHLPSILIVGTGKSGTSALFYCVKESAEAHYGVRFPSIFEPQDEEQASRLNGDFGIVKVVSNHFQRVSHIFGPQFNQRIYIYRDPRDNIISRLLWHFAARLSTLDDDSRSTLMEMFLRKERDPDSISVLSLYRQFSVTTNRPDFARSSKYWAYHPVTFLASRADFAPLRYEHFVEWDAHGIGNIERQLGFPLKQNFVVPVKAARVRRTVSHGYFRNWFLDEDYDYFADAARLKILGYDSTIPNVDRLVISPSEVSDYVAYIASFPRKRHNSGQNDRVAKGVI